MKHLFALLAVICMSICSAKASTIDTWSAYFSHFDATEVVEGDGKVYAVASGNLYSYAPATQEVRLYDRITHPFSSKGIKYIGYSNSLHTIVIVYADGNIDLFDTRHETITNIPQFRDNPDNDFAINNLKVQDNDAFIATNEGFLWIDIRNQVVKGRYTIGKTSCALRYGDNIYASLATGGVITVSVHDNMNDGSQWTTFSELYITDMGVAHDNLYLACPYTDQTNLDKSYGIWAYSPQLSFSHISGRAAQYIRTCCGRIMMYSSDTVIRIDDEKPRTASFVATKHGCNSMCPASDGGYWTAAPTVGLTHYVIDADNNFLADANPVDGGGPRHELPYWLRFEGDRLMMVPGRVDTTDKDNRPWYAAWLDPDTHEWLYFEEPYGGNAGAGPWLRKNHDFLNVTSIAQDPRDPNHHFVTSGRQGLFEYRDRKIVAQYTEGNSPLRSCSDSKSYDYVRTSCAMFDKDNNLFVINSGGGNKNQVETPVWCLKPDGTWLSFNCPAIFDASCFENAIFDRKGRLWATQRRTASGINGGFLCMDFNGTLDNTNDDVYYYRTSFTNQDGAGYSFQLALAIAEDLDGCIWLGTEVGLFVCDTPDEWANPEMPITQVKVPRPDGIYADYLLNGSVITAIAVDGANRKWIGTSGDGVYLISADRIHTLHHFTTDNSPLVSNNILSIACHPTNGEVFIGTELGLMSYHSDASEANESLQRDNLRVYPNPVRPEYSGPVVLDGLVYDSDIKVVSTSGHVVAAGTSVGGTFTWDGRGPSGERVGSGIYYFMVVTPDAKENVVAKVAIVR